MSPTTRRPLTLLTLLALLSLLLAGLPLPQRAMAASGMIGRWTFDEGGGAVATDSAGDNDGAVGGGALSTNGTPPSAPSPWALTFDGADDAVSIPGEADFDLGALTVTAWVRVDAFTRDWQAIVTKGDNAWRLHRAENSGFVGFGTTGLTNVDLEGTVRIDDGQWHHVAGTYDGARKAIYVDGALDVSVDVRGSLKQNNYPVMIGGNAQVGNRLFNGAIDDVRIYSRALSAGEIAVVARVGAVTTVTSANDSGPGSLRQAIADAPSGGTIVFAGDYTIPLASSSRPPAALSPCGRARRFMARIERICHQRQRHQPSVRSLSP